MSDKRQTGSAPSCKVHPHGPSNIAVTSEVTWGLVIGAVKSSRSLWHVLHTPWNKRTRAPLPQIGEEDFSAHPDRLTRVSHPDGEHPCCHQNLAAGKPPGPNASATLKMPKEGTACENQSPYTLHANSSSPMVKEGQGDTQN